MNGELAQVIALVAHTRAALSGESFALETSSAAFGAVGSVVFEVEEGDGAGAWTYRPVATSPREWTEYLSRAAYRELQLVLGKPVKALLPHAAGTLPDAGRWLAIAVHDGEARAWYGSWDIVKGAPRDQLWSVRYRDFACAPLSGVGDDVATASSKLGVALRAAESVARDGALEGWAKLFAAALGDLEGGGAAGAVSGRAVLLPSAGYTEAAHRLLAACHRAYVFGGMGSWNDLEMPDAALRRRYGEVTPVLHEAVRQGLVVAVNRGLLRDG